MVQRHPRSEQRVDERSSLLRLIHASRQKLLAYLDRHVPDDLRRLIDPEDLFQGVCFRASRQANGAAVPVDPDEGLRWLMTIGRNLLIDRVRELRAQKRGGNALVVEEIRHGSMVMMLEELAVYRRTPSASAANHEFREALERALLTLPDDQRQAVRLRYVEGLSQAQTAAQMGRTADSVQKLCARGLATLRTQLQTASMYL